MLSQDNRRARRAALRSYGLSRHTDLSSLQEIVDLVTSLCGAPMGDVSLIGEQRQWVVAQVGPGPAELPLEDTLCAAVFMGPDAATHVAMIEDTRRDPRTAEVDICTGAEGVRFYAAAPLLTPQGRIIGSLAVMDRRPRRLSRAQLALLAVLSRQAMAQLDLRRLLRRADVMRREVDHRVKNSLQSVSSLTRLQARRVTSSEARESLEVVSRRIDTIAALNSELYRSGNERRLALGGLLDSVVRLIRASAPEHVTVAMAMDEVNVGAGHAGSLAIIVNEFATNSFKHAFPDGRAGRIDFLGRVEGSGQFRLTCRDDGVGFDPSRSVSGLGMSIIESAVESLGGDKTMTSAGRGTELEVVFGI